MEARCSHVHEVKVYWQDLYSDTQSTVQFIGKSLLTSRMKTRVSCLDTPAGRWPSAVESTTNQTLVTRILWTTCWHHCISLSIRSISRIVQLYWFKFNPYFFVLEGWQIEIRLFLKDSGDDNETCVHKFFLKFSNRWVFDRVVFSLIINVIDRNFKNY